MFKENKDARFSPDLLVAFSEWLKGNGVLVALLDLDDTVFDTSVHFIKKFRQFCEFASRVLEVDPEKIMRELEDLNDHYYHTLGVSTSKLEKVVEDLSVMYKSEELKSGISILRSIYTTSPDIYPGAIETLSEFKNNGIRLGAVTHAPPGWTATKLENLNFFEHVENIDVDKEKRKESKHWKQAIDTFGVPSTNVMVVGDNAPGDIVAAYETGVRNLFKVKTRWKKYEGDLPQGVIEIENIKDLIPRICQKK